MRMSGRLLLAPVVAAVAIGVAASPAAAKQVKLTIADTGKTVSVSKGDTISISLASNQTTPYHWVVTTKPNAKVAKVTKAKYVGAGTGVPGEGGQQQYVIAAKGAGKTSFKTEYQEISSGEVGSGKSTFAITIKVKK